MKFVADDVSEILIDEQALKERISSLGRQITVDYRGERPVLVGVLKGAAMFLVDLARQIDLPLEIDFMAISSYGTSTRSSGIVRILKDLDRSIDGRHVLVIEDIVDTGLTLRYILENLATRSPASLRVCALLRKTRANEVLPDIDYVGFEIADRFVVGYGLDYAELYRNLPFVGILRPPAASES